MTDADRDPQPEVVEVTFQDVGRTGGQWHRALEEAVRKALADVEGPWSVNIGVGKRGWWSIAVVGPDGSSWMTHCAGRDHPVPEEVAERVRSACRRYRLRQERQAATPAAGGTERAAPKRAKGVEP